jgi:hypothetical protein
MVIDAHLAPPAASAALAAEGGIEVRNVCSNVLELTQLLALLPGMREYLLESARVGETQMVMPSQPCIAKSTTTSMPINAW